LFLCLFGAGEGKQSRLPKRFESEQNWYLVKVDIYIYIFFLRDAFPLCVQNRYKKIRRTQQKVIYWLHRATSFDPTMGSSSGQRLN
jgi:hypothetical protein